ncbi:transcription factor TFIIF complex subunit Tfg3 [Xanthoria calcicola]
MPDVKRTVRIITEQRPNQKPSGVEGFPMRSWKISLVLLNENDGSEMPATIFEKATYKLHPTFGDRETQVIKKPPFKISEEGWGEFDMRIIVSAIDKGGDHELSHDLNFQQERYEAEHKITFKNPKPNLLEKLKESGPVGVGGEENGVKPKRGDESARKRKRSEKGVDMEKLAESLQRLGEEDLLQVVEMVHNNKTSDTYTKNDVEQGEFHVDLYTLPDSLVRMLWDFCVEKLGS